MSTYSLLNNYYLLVCAYSDCERSPDVIVVRDGTDVRSPVLVRFCNTHNSEQITSSGETLSIELQVDDKKQRQGFAATFHFVKEQYVSNSSKSTTSSPFLPPPASGKETQILRCTNRISYIKCFAVMAFVLFINSHPIGLFYYT